MLKSSLCDYSDTYILAKGTVTVPNTAAADANANNANIKITEINNTQGYSEQDIYIMMLYYKYSLNQYLQRRLEFLSLLQR